jgi:hypothetical protein
MYMEEFQTIFSVVGFEVSPSGKYNFGILRHDVEQSGGYTSYRRFDGTFCLHIQCIKV